MKESVKILKEKMEDRLYDRSKNSEKIKLYTDEWAENQKIILSIGDTLKKLGFDYKITKKEYKFLNGYRYEVKLKPLKK